MSFIKAGRGRKVCKCVLAVTSLLVLFAIGAGLLLRHGVRIEQLNLGRFEAHDVLVIWNRKLELQITEVTIHGSEGINRSETLPVDTIANGISTYCRLFSKISIETLVIGSENGTFSAEQTGDNTIITSFSGNSLELAARLRFTANRTAVIDILEARSKRYRTNLSGRLHLNGPQRQVAGKLQANLAKVLPVAIEFIADDKGIRFEGRENGSITTIKPFVDLFGLDPDIQRWITEYLSGTRYQLEAFTGNFPWSKPELIINNLFAKVRVENCQYTFAPGLEPIKTNYTTVVFSKGVLEIIPVESTFYGQNGQHSRLNIDFNDPSGIVLTAYIKTDAVANDDILTLLEYYNIALPVKQLSGTTATDLTLTVNLNVLQVRAAGSFNIRESTILWRDTEFFVPRGTISLQDKTVGLKELEVSLQKLISATVEGTIELSPPSGSLIITPEKVQVIMRETPLELKKKPESPSLFYTFTEENSELRATVSTWRYGDSEITLGPFTAALDLEQMTVDMPKTELSINQQLLMSLSGPVSMRPFQLDLSCKLHAFSRDKLSLYKTEPSFTITYNPDSGAQVTTSEDGYFVYDELPFTLSPTEVGIRGSTLTLKESGLAVGDIFKSRISGSFELATRAGVFSLRHDEKLEERIELHIEKADDLFMLRLPGLSAEFVRDNGGGWKLFLGEIKKVAEYFPKLSTLQLRDGSATIYSEDGHRPYSFSARGRLVHPYLVIDNEPTAEVEVQGEVASNGIFSTINGIYQLAYTKKKLTVNGGGSGFHLIKVIDLAKTLEPASEKQIEKSAVDLTIFDTHLYLSDASRILADQLDLSLVPGENRIVLKHGDGTIKAVTEAGNFSLEAENLNHIFTGNLLHNSQFHKGALSLVAKGRFDDFSMLARIENTTIKSMTWFNNIMAFLNTVPALVTFSVPEYSTKGLSLDSVLVGMMVHDRNAEIKTLKVQSPQFTMEGGGTVNFNSREVDLTINLTSKARTNLRKIPLVGYVVTGTEEDATASIVVKGDINDPDVANTLVKNVVSTPFSILSRILNLPVQLVKKVINPDQPNNGD